MRHIIAAIFAFFRPKEGFVPNAEPAVRVSEAVLIPVCGEKRIVSDGRMIIRNLLLNLSELR